MVDFEHRSFVFIYILALFRQISRSADVGAATRSVATSNSAKVSDGKLSLQDRRLEQNDLSRQLDIQC